MLPANSIMASVKRFCT